MHPKSTMHLQLAYTYDLTFIAMRQRKTPFRRDKVIIAGETFSTRNGSRTERSVNNPCVEMGIARNEIPAGGRD